MSDTTEEKGCTACGSVGGHTVEECSARRPQCHVYRCEKVTCIQAMHHGAPPTCLDHFFVVQIEAELRGALKIAQSNAVYWETKAEEWREQARWAAEECERVWARLRNPVEETGKLESEIDLDRELFTEPSP